MIQNVSGDILLSHADAIVHGVAPHDDFHQGLALALREKWPALYKDFRHYCKTLSPHSGGLWSWMGADGRHIVSLFTQQAAPPHGGHPGRASTTYVAHALKALHALVQAEGWKSIALPKLATGAGGLLWSDVEPLIHQHLGSLSAKVLVYTTYHPGQAGEEGL